MADMFVCLEVVPRGDTIAHEDSTEDIFRKAARGPAGYVQQFRVFETLAAAKEYEGRSATLTTIPLVIEHNPLLGY